MCITSLNAVLMKQTHGAVASREPFPLPLCLSHSLYIKTDTKSSEITSGSFSPPPSPTLPLCLCLSPIFPSLPPSPISEVALVPSNFRQPRGNRGVPLWVTHALLAKLRGRARQWEARKRRGSSHGSFISAKGVRLYESHQGCGGHCAS